MCVDLVDPYNITDKTGCDRVLHAMTFKDPATGWFEITKMPVESSAKINQKSISTWLTRYPRPQQIIFDNGNVFKKHFLPL